MVVTIFFASRSDAVNGIRSSYHDKSTTIILAIVAVIHYKNRMTARRTRRTEPSFAAAARAVGSTPPERWTWLTNVAERPVPHTGTAEARQLALEVELFSGGAIEAGAALQFHAKPGSEDLADIHALATKLVDHVRTGHGWCPFAFTGRVEPSVWIAPTQTPGELTIVTMITTPRAVDFFLTAVLDLLPRLRGKIRRCLAPQCGRLFVFRRSHQRYCSTPCQSRAGTARFIEREGGKQAFAMKRSA